MVRQNIINHPFKTFQQTIIHMFANLRFFEREYEKHLRTDFAIDVRLSPCKLINDLKSGSSRRQFIKCMTKKTQNGIKLMRRLTIAHLLIIYDNSFYDLVDQFVSEPFDSGDQWLNQQCIRTYFHFLKKATASNELYIRVKDYSVKEVCFESLFYIVNLMTDMFKIVAKMPLLGRYFKESHEIVTSSFVETIAVQAQKLYTVFKNSLQEMLSNPRKYIKNREDERIMKVILQQSLTLLNQQMKKLFLDKYFYPYGKGIGIRLFRTEEQPEQTIKIINGIISDHKDTERNLAQATLEKTMFPEDGKVNIEFFERTLKPTENKAEEAVIRDLDQIEEGEEEVIPTEIQETVVGEKIAEKVLKETSHHMQICNDV